MRRGTLTAQWHDLIDGFWFVPGLVALVGPALAILCLQLDYRFDQGAGSVTVAFLFGGSPSAARSILSTIASSLITVAALIFTLTITTLQLTSSQFTPRALRGFLSDRLFQVVAGGFVGIFAYCLLVLTAVRDVPQAGRGFVPALGVTVGIGLSFVGLALLLIFIHHMTQSIQVSTITARLAHEALHAIDRLYPTDGEPRDADAAALVRFWRAASAPRLIYPARPGYVQSIDLDRLLDDATRSGLCLHLTACPGDFVAPGDAIAEVWPAGAVDADRAAVIRQSVNVRDQRDLTQDVGFAVRQLADIALKALSPGINDPTTAVTSIGYLRAVLDRLASRDLPADVRQSTDGRAVVVTRQRTFREYVEVFVEIGRVAATNARVADAVLDALATIAATAARRGDDRCVALLREAADTVAAPALADARTAHDRALLKDQLARVARATRPAMDMDTTGERASRDHQPATTDTIGAEKGDEG